MEAGLAVEIVISLASKLVSITLRFLGTYSKVYRALLPLLLQR